MNRREAILSAIGGYCSAVLGLLGLSKPARGVGPILVSVWIDKHGQTWEEREFCFEFDECSDLQKLFERLLPPLKTGWKRVSMNCRLHPLPKGRIQLPRCDVTERRVQHSGDLPIGA